jgi:hypothetical protein
MLMKEGVTPTTLARSLRVLFERLGATYIKVLASDRRVCDVKCVGLVEARGHLIRHGPSSAHPSHHSGLA